MRELVKRFFISKSTLVISDRNFSSDNLPLIVKFQANENLQSIVFNQFNFTAIPENFRWSTIFDSVSELEIIKCCANESSLVEILSDIPNLKTLEIQINCNSFNRLIHSIGRTCRNVTVFITCNSNHSLTEKYLKNFVSNIESLRIYPENYCDFITFTPNIDLLKKLEKSLKYLYLDFVFNSKTSILQSNIHLSWFNKFNFNLQSLGITIDTGIDDKTLENFAKKMYHTEEMHLLWFTKTYKLVHLECKMKIIADNMENLKQLIINSNHPIYFEMINLMTLKKLQVCSENAS